MLYASVSTLQEKGRYSSYYCPYLCFETSKEGLDLEALLVGNLESFFGRGTAAATADICRCL
jgi:hypothetical protein